MRGKVDTLISVAYYYSIKLDAGSRETVASTAH